MKDLAERLQDIIYGFTTDSESEWETIVGFKKGRFITVGTGTPVQPTGTGSEAAIDIYGKTVGDDEKVELFVIDADANEIQLTDKGNRLPNNEWFKVTNKDGDGYVEVFKVDADDRVRIPGVVPVGAQLLWPTTTAPDGWLLCQGQALSRTTYADLFAVIGTTFGAGDGSTTFNLPDWQGLMPVGRDSSDSDFSYIGQTGGAKTKDISHTHTILAATTYTKVNSNGTDGDNRLALKTGNNGQYEITRDYINSDILVPSSGSSAQDVMNPHMVTNMIIKY
jgi:microcystin-dependent protein